MIHPDTAVNHVSNTIGDGVFATAFIPKGTLVYVKDPLEIELTPTQFNALADPIRDMADKYSYIDERGHRILSWDTAKYVNHSCEPNTISSGYGFEIALRDIRLGEQITDEYGLFNLEWRINCHCGSENCRGVIRGGDIDEYADVWDQWVLDALQHVRDVEQPLWPFLEHKKAAALNRFLDTGKSYRSVRSLRRGVRKAAPSRRAEASQVVD